MLAHVYDPSKHDLDGWWFSEKYDGVRAKWDGEKMESRAGNIYNIPDFLVKQLKSLKDKDGNPLKLDGELWGGRDTFAITSGIVRRHQSDPELWGNIVYLIFDIPVVKNTFEERILEINNSYVEASKKVNLSNIDIVEYTRFDTNETTVEEQLRLVEDNKGEGLIFRKPSSLYEFKRSNNMLKVKSWVYDEAVVYGYEAGKEGRTGKTLGLVGSLLVKAEINGKTVKFKVGSGLNDNQRYSGRLQERLSTIKKWDTNDQIELDQERMLYVDDGLKKNKDYKKMLDIVKVSNGKDRIEALTNLNEVFSEIPGINFNNVITFKYKELTKNGIPSMPIFIAVRSDIVISK